VNKNYIFVIIFIAIGIILILSQTHLMTIDDNLEQRQVNTASPNFVVIMTDDLSLNVLNTMLDNHLMPNLKKFIIDDGIEFKNSFVTTSTCCPSRSTFLTGQYSHNHGVLNNKMILNFDDEHTLATWLHNDGIRTSLIGKYLNGYGKTLSENHIPPGWDNWQALLETTTVVYENKFNDNGNIIQYGTDEKDYQTFVISKLAQDFISDSENINDEQAFFLLLTATAPHQDGQADKSCYANHDFRFIRIPEQFKGIANDIDLPKSPSFNETDVSDKPKYISKRDLINNTESDCLTSIFQNQIESMTIIDEMIGNVSQALIDNNEFSNTVIIFTSDNGFLLGEHRIGHKGYSYEESIRVPLYIKMPGQIGSKEVSSLVINNDLAPTILELAGSNSDISIDGRSLIPLFNETKNENWRDKFLIEHYAGLKNIPTSAVRNESYILIDNREKQIDEFYDLKIDPYQLNNIYDCTSLPCKDIIKDLRDVLIKLKNCSGNSCQVFENKIDS